MRKSYSISTFMFISAFSFYCLTFSGWRVKADDTASVKDRFVGAWRLAWLEEPDSNSLMNVYRISGSAKR